MQESNNRSENKTIQSGTSKTKPKRSGWRKIDKAEFKMVKTLLDAGVTITQVAKLRDRSYSTILYIRRSDNLEDYLKMVNDRARYNKAKAAERRAREAAKQVKTRSGEVDSKDSKESSENHTESVAVAPVTSETTAKDIARIATALERLADAWERKPEEPKKTGLFR